MLTVVTLGGDTVLNVTTISAVVVRVFETTPTGVNKFGKSVLGNDGLSTDITARSVGVNISSVQTVVKGVVSLDGTGEVVGNITVVVTDGVVVCVISVQALTSVFFTEVWTSALVLVTTILTFLPGTPPNVAVTGVSVTFVTGLVCV